MKKDPFFHEEYCQRCRHHLRGGRTVSWFTEETICMECSEREDELKKQLRKEGRDTDALEGCGHVPKPVTKNWR